MRLLVIASAALFTLVAARPSRYIPQSTKGSDLLAQQALTHLLTAAKDGSLNQLLATKGVSQRCSARDVVVRKEYADLSNKEKLDYTRAVICLMDLPSKTPPGVAPGAKSRYDDFVALHVALTRQMHFSGYFFAWHRYYLLSWERALRDECGYQGYQPYWNWAKSSVDPINSPYFDGSKYSQGGNGIWSPHNCTYPSGNPDITPYCIPVVEGRGGGCVMSGPYVGRMANISATQPTLRAPDAPKGDKENLNQYQPRCIRRDISPEVSSIFGTDELIVDQLTNPEHASSIGPFQDRFQGWPINVTYKGIQYLGLHAQGHLTIGGDPGGDVYVSPSDPAFWIHHTQVDRIWWIWQNLNITDRAFQIAGTKTMFNVPPSDLATIEDIIDMQYLTPEGMGPLPVKEMASTMGGPFCYVYA